MGLAAEVDTRRVTLTDSSAIALLAGLARQVSGRLKFINPPGVVRFLLEATHLDEAVDILDADTGFPAGL